MSTGDLNTLSALMRNDWNRRMKHDFRFWTTAAFATDEAFYQAGRSDLLACLSGIAIDTFREKTLLDIGCGIGRMLPQACALFSHVYGLDVSSEALKRAADDCLPNEKNLSLLEGDGVTLRDIPTESIDVIVSYGTIGLLPTLALASYFPEMSRVLKPNGQARLQCFIGEGSDTSDTDTLASHQYSLASLERTAKACGFVLRFEGLSHNPTEFGGEHGGRPTLCIFEKREPCTATIDSIWSMLAPRQEDSVLNTVTESFNTSHETEYRASVNYADSLISRGDYSKAKQTIDYAAQFLDTVTIDLRDIFERVQLKLAMRPETNSDKIDFYSLNFPVIVKRFSTLADALTALPGERSADIEVKESLEGPTIFEKNVALDHANKPVTAAAAWARGLHLNNEKDSIIIGFGLGYHLEKILEDKKASGRLLIIEPNIEVLRTAFQTRDLRVVLEGIDYLTCTAIPAASLSEKTGIIVRPQAQLLHSEFVSDIKSQMLSERALATLKPSMAIVGPRHGGTLPMLGYLANGLSLMNQRVRPYDFSMFDSGYTHIETLLKDKFRQTHAHMQFTEAVSEVALQALLEKPIDILITLPFAPLSPRVLDELRRQGVITVLWFVEDFQRFDMWKVLAKHYDFIFTIQKGQAIEVIQSAGAGHVSYLPVGCDPMIHSPQSLTPQERERYGSKISFMGSGYHNRQQMFAALSEYPLKIWGTEWPTSRPFDKLVQENGRRLLPVEYMKVFAASDININLHSSGERDGVDPFGDFVNPRTFELAAAGAFQLVDNRALLPECFEIGKEIITFSDGRDLKNKINYFLEHPEERREIAERARNRVLKDHTYISRLRSMMKTIVSQRHDFLSQKLAGSPWNKMKERAANNEDLTARCEKAWLRGEEPTLDGLVSDVVVGQGKLSPTEQRLMFLYHIKRSTIRMREEELGLKPKGNA